MIIGHTEFCVRRQRKRVLPVSLASASVSTVCKWSKTSLELAANVSFPNMKIHYYISSFIKYSSFNLRICSWSSMHTKVTLKFTADEMQIFLTLICFPFECRLTDNIAHAQIHHEDHLQFHCFHWVQFWKSTNLKQEWSLYESARKKMNMLLTFR